MREHGQGKSAEFLSLAVDPWTCDLIGDPKVYKLDMHSLWSKVLLDSLVFKHKHPRHRS